MRISLLCVVAVPEVGVSTPRAFQEWDSLCEHRGKYGGPSTAALRASARDDASFGGSKGLTGPGQPDRLELLSHVYASALRAPASDASGIVRGTPAERKQPRPEGGSVTGEDGPKESAQNGLAGNPLLALVRTGIENDFEQVVFPQHPSLRDIKRVLEGLPAGEGSADASGAAIYAALSGSGSALFGLYRTEDDAVAAQQRVQAYGCRAIVTSTLPRAEYWSRMLVD